MGDVILRAWMFGGMGRDVQIFDPVVIVKPEVIEIGDYCRIDSFVKLEGGLALVIGARVHIASFAHLNIGGGELWIGDGAAFASGSKVISGSNTPEGVSLSAVALPEDQKIVRSRTVIGKNATVLTNAVVLPGAVLWEGSILAAGGVATKDIPPFEIWGGVPARKIGVRNPGRNEIDVLRGVAVG